MAEANQSCYGDDLVEALKALFSIKPSAGADGGASGEVAASSEPTPDPPLPHAEVDAAKLEALIKSFPRASGFERGAGYLTFEARNELLQVNVRHSRKVIKRLSKNFQLENCQDSYDKELVHLVRCIYLYVKYDNDVISRLSAHQFYELDIFMYADVAGRNALAKCNCAWNLCVHQNELKCYDLIQRICKMMRLVSNHDTNW